MCSKTHKTNNEDEIGFERSLCSVITLNELSCLFNKNNFIQIQVSDLKSSWLYRLCKTVAAKKTPGE